MEQTLFKIFDKFWGVTEKKDDANHATQHLPEGITEENDFAYLPDGDRLHLLDAYYPADNNGKLPVVIDIHGGGWMYGDKELNKIYCEYIAARGFLVFNVSYRLAPQVTVREQLQDVCAALQWIGAHLGDFPADKNALMLTGDSAGGQLSAYAAALSVSEPLRRFFDCADFGLRFNCVTLTSPVAYMNVPGYMGVYGRLMWGEPPFKRCVKTGLNFDDLIDQAPDFPPALLVTSSGDFLALEQTRNMHRLLMEKGVSSRLLDFPKFEGKNLGHVFAVMFPESHAGRLCMDTMAAFFREHI